MRRGKKANCHLETIFLGKTTPGMVVWVRKPQNKGNDLDNIITRCCAGLKGQHQPWKKKGHLPWTVYFWGNCYCLKKAETFWVMFSGQYCRRMGAGDSAAAWFGFVFLTLYNPVLSAGLGAVCVQLQRADADRAAAVHCWSLPTAAGGSSQDGTVVCPEDFQCWCVWRNPQKVVWGHQVTERPG